MSRVVFYSVGDGASGRNLLDAALLLKTTDVNASFDINDLLEFKNVQLYFENEMFLTEWDEDTVAGFKEKLIVLDAKIKQYFLSIDDSIFDKDLNSVEYHYRKAYWTLFNNLHAYKKISATTFSPVLSLNPFHISFILSHKKIVDHFNLQLRDFLVASEDAAELILSAFEENTRFEKNEVHFPKALSLDDKRNIISSYVEGAEPNINYINLIEHAKDSPQLKLTSKIRLQAQKKAKQLTDTMLADNTGTKFGISVSFDLDQQELKMARNDGLNTEHSYSRSYLDSLQDDTKLFECFTQLFEYLDIQQLITLVAKESERDVMERILMSSKNAYPGGISFNYKARLALMQITMFDAYLKHRGTSVEKLIDSFMRNNIQKEAGLQRIRFTLPDENTSHLSKIRLLAPEMEFLLKQYQCFVEEGTIDFDLLQINTSQLSFSAIGSRLSKKYVYPNTEAFARLRYLFFSDQSPLHYLERYGDKYRSFYNLIEHEDVQLNHFENYQRFHIDKLIEEDYLKVDDAGCVQFDKPVHIFLLALLYQNGVINYWRCNQQLKSAIDEMVEVGLLEFGSSLLSKDEVSYFNYFLNQKEFTDGFNIRNKYMHGTNEHDAGQQQTDYYFLLIVIVLTLFKIDDDLLCYTISNKNLAS